LNTGTTIEISGVTASLILEAKFGATIAVAS
jgi:hypothetical protein